MSVIRRAQVNLINFKLQEAVGGSGVSAVDAVIVELEDDEGTKGLGFSYVLGGGGGLALDAVQKQISDFVLHKPISAPRAQWLKVVQSFAGAQRGLVDIEELFAAGTHDRFKV